TSRQARPRLAPITPYGAFVPVRTIECPARGRVCTIPGGANRGARQPLGPALAPRVAVAAVVRGAFSHSGRAGQRIDDLPETASSIITNLDRVGMPGVCRWRSSF